MEIVKALKFDDAPRLLRIEILHLMEFYNMHHVPSKEMPELDLNNFFLAIYHGLVVGAAGYKMTSPTTGKTTLMAVHPRMAGRGIGKLLQQARMEEMAKLGAQSIITNADRPKTIEWYKKYFGYKEIGKLQKIHPFGLPDISFWTTLQTTQVG